MLRGVAVWSLRGEVLDCQQLCGRIRCACCLLHVGFLFTFASTLPMETCSSETSTPLSTDYMALYPRRYKSSLVSSGRDFIFHFNNYIMYAAYHGRSQQQRGIRHDCLRSLGRWDRGFQSHSRHECLVCVCVYSVFR
jgi:hypothetical protein